MKRKTWVLPAFAVLSLLSILAIQITFLPWKLNSDSAFMPIMVAWQVKTGQFFPDGMCYSTGIAGISSNLFMIPGYLLSGGNLTVARISGICLLHILLFFLLYRVFQTEKKRDLLSPSIAALLFMIPFLGSAATEQYLVEGAYLNQVLWILGAMLAFRAFVRAVERMWEHRALANAGATVSISVEKSAANAGSTEANAPASSTRSKKRGFFAKDVRSILLYGLLIILIIVAADMHAYRNLLTAFLPLTLTWLLWFFYRQKGAPDLRDLARKWLPLAAVALIGAALAVCVYLLLSRLYWPTTNQTSLELGAGIQFTNRLHALVNSLVSIVGNANAAPLLSVRGVAKLAGYVAAALLYLVVPVYSLRHFGKFHRDVTRFLIAFSWIGSFFTIIIVLAADLALVGNDTSRYCLPIFANCLLMTAAVLGDLLSEAVPQQFKVPADRADIFTDVSSMDTASISGPAVATNVARAGSIAGDSNTANKLSDGEISARPVQHSPGVKTRWLQRAIPALLIAFAIFSHAIYWKVTWNEHFLLPDPYKMTGFLLENNLHHGYASYWYAHRFTALTNFDLTIANIRVEANFIRPDYWLTNKAYYKTDFGADRCFLMLTDDELAGFAPEGLANTPLGEPVETLRYNQFYILVYDENIGSADRLAWTEDMGYRG